MTRGSPAALRSKLLAWYDTHRRELPWRAAPGEASSDPYRVWLSEVMLQQTRVETVKPYYARWLECFPDLHALASAPEDEVLKCWEGLGYYSRARNFHRAARALVEDSDGVVPPEPERFRALPGVGRYTAGAVMSIAFGREEPVVDGNVRRVFARLADEAEPDPSELWTRAAELVRGERPGDLNQALMELGATICSPRNPGCDRCPVQVHCAARAAGTQAERPRPRRAVPLPHEETAVAVICDGTRLLMVKRAQRARLGGMWAFPQAVRRPGEPMESAVRRAAEEAVGLETRVGEEIGSVAHVFTHVRATYRAFRCVEPRGAPRPIGCDALEWIDPAAPLHLPLPVAQRRILALAVALPTPQS